MLGGLRCSCSRQAKAVRRGNDLFWSLVSDMPTTPARVDCVSGGEQLPPLRGRASLPLSRVVVVLAAAAVAVVVVVLKGN